METKLRRLNRAEFNKQSTSETSRLIQRLSFDYDLFAFLIGVNKIFFTLIQFRFIVAAFQEHKRKSFDPGYFRVMLNSSVYLVVFCLVALKFYIFKCVHVYLFEEIVLGCVLHRYLTTVLGMNCYT